MIINDPMKSIPGNMNRVGTATADIVKTEEVVGDSAYESVEKCEVVIEVAKVYVFGGWGRVQ